MAIELTITGNGKFGGHSTSLINYSADEDSTPTDPNDSSGGYGQLTFEAVEDEDSDGSPLLINDGVTLSDGSNGRTGGVVTAVEANDGIVTVTSSSRIGILRARAQAQPYSGTLAGAFAYYLSLAGVVSGYTVDATIASRPVAFPGWNDEVFVAVKRLCAAQEVEMSLVSNNIVLRPLRTRIAQNVHDTARGWSITNNDLAQNIEIYYYLNQQRTNYLAYPPDISIESPSIGPVGDGETVILTADLSSSLSAVNQPIPVTDVDPWYTGPDSVYTVIGKDNQPVDPIWWQTHGGSITAVIGEDTRTLTITVVGATDTEGLTAPYRIAQMDGEDTINTLKVTGTGVFFNKQLITIPTGAEVARTAQVVGATVDNEFITTLAEAYTAGLRTAQSYGSPDQQIRISATVVNRTGEHGSVKYPTFNDFNTINAGKTFNTFNTATGSTTFDQFADAYYLLVADNFENQAFGNAAGARVKFRDAWYRARKATITPEQIDYTAERDTMFSDLNTVWSGKTFADFNTRWAGKSFEDMAVIPLWA
jgi:hypothetical protein